jgi:hypothetical protein
MKLPKDSVNSSRPLLDPWRFPLGAQTGPTAGRDKIREVAYPVRAPRQSKRRVERTSKT